MSGSDDSNLNAHSTPEGTQAPSLTAADLQLIDECLLSHTSKEWQKVARIIGSTMAFLGSQFPNVPDVFCAQRIKHLAEAGAIEVGGLNRIRYCEVRIADTAAVAKGSELH
jgi:hypothetical protein